MLISAYLDLTNFKINLFYQDLEFANEYIFKCYLKDKE